MVATTDGRHWMAAIDPTKGMSSSDVNDSSEVSRYGGHHTLMKTTHYVCDRAHMAMNAPTRHG